MTAFSAGQESQLIPARRTYKKKTLTFQEELNTAIREILQLGDPTLYRKCAEVSIAEIDDIRVIVDDLHDTLFDFRRRYGAGRAIAAPQIGVVKRLIYMYLQEPVVFINPVISNDSEEMFELWDDCMSFRDLFVRVRRHKRCRITFRDLRWQENSLDLSDDLSELLQHECNHLDGILAVSRAIDGKSFALRSEIDRLR